MSEMIDRVAKAVFDDYDWSFVPDGGFADQELHVQEIFRNLARAAIEAMRDIFQETAMAAEFQSDMAYELFSAVKVIDAALAKVDA